MKRTDDYESRSAHLKSLTDEQLEARFWELANKLVDPMLKMGYEYTSPSIERSVLLRMGFSSIEAKSIVDGCIEHNLIGSLQALRRHKDRHTHRRTRAVRGQALAGGRGTV